MSEQMPDALFGVDGTEPPESLPDPSARGGGRGTSALSPSPLPAMPDLRMTPEAIAAVLGEDPTGPVDQDPGATPAQQPAAPPSGAPPEVSQANAPPTNVVPPPNVVAQPNVTAPLPTPSAPQAGGPPPAGAPGHRPAPVVPAPALPAQPLPRRPGGLGYRPPLAVGSRSLVQFGDLRRRVSRQSPRLPPQTRSNGGAGVFFIITLIVFGVLAYSIITGIVESVSRLFQ